MNKKFQWISTRNKKKNTTYNTIDSSTKDSLNTSFYANFSLPSSPCNSKSYQDKDTEDYQLSEKIRKEYPLVGKWFDNYCKPKGLRVRKSLIIYYKIKDESIVELATNLTKCHNDYLIIRKDFSDYKGIEKNPPKLVILDDMELSSFKYIEIWKKLLSGQRVISYYSTSSGIINWNYKIPCVVLTNNLLIVMRIFQNEELRKYAIFQEIVNTRNDFNEIEIDFSNEIMQYLLKEELINTKI